MKQCGKCNIFKELYLFPLSKKGKFGRRSDCKECHNKNYHLRKHIYKEQRKQYRDVR